MDRRFSGLRKATLLVVAFVALASCGGGSDDAATPAAAPNAPPAPVITSPAEGALFKAGDTLTFAGSATDPEDGTLGAASLTWWVELHHDEHTHPIVQPGPGGSGTVVVSTRGETSDNIWLRFHLKAVDRAGLSTEVTRDVRPQKVQFTLATQPTGLSSDAGRSTRDGTSHGHRRGRAWSAISVRPTRTSTAGATNSATGTTAVPRAHDRHAGERPHIHRDVCRRGSDDQPAARGFTDATGRRQHRRCGGADHTRLQLRPTTNRSPACSSSTARPP